MITAAQMAALAAQGRYWWQRPDATVYATAERVPDDAEDTYLADASPDWVAQWGGNWSAAVEVTATELGEPT